MGERDVWDAEPATELSGARKAAIAWARMAAVEALRTRGERERRPLERERERERLSRLSLERERRLARRSRLGDLPRRLERCGERERTLRGDRDLDRRERRCERSGDLERRTFRGERTGDRDLRLSENSEDCVSSELDDDADPEVEGDRFLLCLDAKSSARR